MREDIFGNDYFKNLDKSHKEKKDEFDRLNANPFSQRAVVGQRIVFACGLVGHGFNYERMEAEIIEVGEVSYKIKYQSTHLKDIYELWIHPSLVTDILEDKDEA